MSRNFQKEIEKIDLDRAAYEAMISDLQKERQGYEDRAEMITIKAATSITNAIAHYRRQVNQLLQRRVAVQQAQAKHEEAERKDREEAAYQAAGEYQVIQGLDVDQLPLWSVIARGPIKFVKISDKLWAPVSNSLTTYLEEEFKKMDVTIVNIPVMSIGQNVLSEENNALLNKLRKI